ncbi:SAM-dependent methyltransferase [Candidatus Francisella endociliophora]|uniref:Ribosomal RNA small subunit methyltransferase I n=1 Tax=Candidatus Francisella endociliophora TaxID=653937 RepID=A0A097EQ01_9GAMM|nr:16S rRNA (cytidine(1402)-2'-O)-methyltransferase [Francisella sp. FSC1006]AIT09654.1 SAM-dependent methyltransferase [Francisella sp. FSC1006]
MNNVEGAILYVVATPIGNLEDITHRAVNVLSCADVILAEDTRVTAKLLASLNIKSEQKLISCHDFNEESRVQQVKELLDDGKRVALVSDAGTPLISDPGYKIVASLRQDNYSIVPIPGVSAVIAALSVAGLPSDNFIFKGFLSAKKTKRQEQIKEIQDLNTTVIVYESVHRIMYLLADLVELIPSYKIAVAKELTKQFEKIVSGSAKEVYEHFEFNQDTVRGEFVVIIDCSDQENQEQAAGVNMDELLKDLLEELPLKKAVKLVVKLTGAKKNQVYDKALKFKDQQDL